MSKLKKYIGIILLLIIIVIGILPFYFDAESKMLNEDTRRIAGGEFIKLTHGITHYEQSGSDTAKIVLLVHGFSVPSYIWDPTYNELSNKGYRVIRYDLYGRGYTDRPNVIYNKELFINQIEDLLKSLKVEKPIDIIGLSMGGPIVTEFTVENPEKVNKIVLIDPFNKAEDISVLSTPIIGEYITNVMLAPSMAESQLEDFYKPNDFADWPDKYEIQMEFKGFKKAILSTLRNYMTEDKLNAYEELGKLVKPVLLIWGKEDQATPYEQNNRIRNVLTCKFLSVEAAGHLPHYEKPEIVNPEIIKFLNE